MVLTAPATPFQLMEVPDPVAGEGEAGALAAHWDGDRYVLIDTGAGLGLAWAVLWSESEARDRFAALVQASGDAFGGPVSVDRTEVNGRPATLMRIGDDSVRVSFGVADEGS